MFWDHELGSSFLKAKINKPKETLLSKNAFNPRQYVILSESGGQIVSSAFAVFEQNWRKALESKIMVSNTHNRPSMISWALKVLKTFLFCFSAKDKTKMLQAKFHFMIILYFSKEQKPGTTYGSLKPPERVSQKWYLKKRKQISQSEFLWKHQPKLNLAMNDLHILNTFQSQS